MLLEYVIPGDSAFPEGITEDPDGEHFFVCSHRTGTVFRCGIGQPEAEVWLPGGQDGRTALIGMTTDRRGRLFACGGETGHVFAYELASGRLLAQRTVPSEPTLLNDMCVVGEFLYVTDSKRPVVWRFDVTDGLGEPELWLDLTRHGADETDLHYLNGIVPTHDGAVLVMAAQGTGRLWRVDVATGAAEPIDLGTAVVNGDGLVYVGDVLYVCDNSEEPDGSVRMWLTALRLTDDARGGSVIGRWERPLTDTPSTVAHLGDRLYIVNAQHFAHFAGQEPKPPFTVSALDVPIR